MKIRLVCSALLIAGCAAPRFPLPMTATELASYGTGDALIAYLGQPDATPTVCDPKAKGPHARPLDGKGDKALVRALTDGKIAPDTWRKCVDSMAKRASPPDAASLVDEIGRGYRTLISRKDFEQNQVLRLRLAAMQRFYLARKAGEGGDTKLDLSLFASLRKALAKHELGPIAQRFGDRLLSAVDAEYGQWQGRVVDDALLDERYGAKDDKTLEMLAERLPSAALRTDAARRIIRLRIAASPFPEVRDDAKAVEDAVLAQGVNAISLVAHAARSATIDPTKMPVRQVVVNQAVWTQTAKLLAYGAGPSVSVLPEIKLRGALMVTLAGISRPVTVCGGKRAFDPTPCIQAGDVHLDNAFAYLDKRGAFRFVDHITMAQAVTLARSRDLFTMPVRVGTASVTQLSWRLAFARPEDVLVSGTQAGEDGPQVAVLVDAHDADRYVFTVATGAVSYLAVVEAQDLPSFHAGSAGAQGAAGSAGADGSPGSDGGECGSGGDGTDGEDGGPGGNGGNGGPVVAQVSCVGDCSAARARLASVIVSLGGAGGPGGNGGSGGDGGAGGTGRAESTHTDADGNTVVDDPGCSGGPSGSDGSSGSDGPPGAPGQPGPVRFE